MMTIHSSRVAILALLLVSIIWGAEFVLIDLAVAEIPTHTFNALRFALAAVSLLPLWWFSRQQATPASDTPYSYRALLGAGLLLGFLLFIGFYTQTEGLRYTTVSNAGFITGLNVPLVPLLGFILFRSAVSNAVWLGIIISTTGLYLLTLGGSLALNDGDLLVLICAFAFASHIVLTGRWIKQLPILPLSIIQLFAVALYSSTAALLSPEPAFYHTAATPIGWQQQLLTPVVIYAILIAGILGTAYAFWAQSASQQRLEPHKVALIFATEPVFAHLSGWLFLDESLGPQGLIGATLIITGMLFAELGDKRRPPKINPLDQTAAPQ